MTKLTAILFMLLAQTALSATLFAPDDLVGVKSEYSYSKTGNPTVYRALIFKGSEEGSSSLGIEKFAPGEYGTPPTIIVQKKFVVTELPGFKPFIDQIAKKSAEAAYGCCAVQNLEWTADKKVTFSIDFSDRIFNKGTIEREGKKVDTAQYSHTEVSSFRCQSSSLEEAEPRINCDKQKALTHKK